MAGLLLSSCGDDSQFRIAGEIAGMGTQNIDIIYYASDALKVQRTIVIDGKFSVVGNAPEATIVEIHSSDNALLGMLMVQNGETVECRLKRGNRFIAAYEGNEVSERWGKFLTENADSLAIASTEQKNNMIARYVAKHPDDMTSTVLLLTEYSCPDNEMMADSLMRSISEQARPSHLVNGFNALLAHINSEAAAEDILPMNLYCRADSLFSYNPSLSRYSILAFSSDNLMQRDSLVRGFKELSKQYKSKELALVDVSFATDTATWKIITHRDSADWNQCWVLGAMKAKPIERLAIPRVPYFIVADSAGKQVYRGSSISKAAKAIDIKK